MTRFVVLSLAALLLASCAAPGPYATPAPDTAAFLAQGTIAAVATFQQSTRVEVTRQAVAVAQATSQAVQATQAAVAVTQAAATATAATREAATAAAVTATAEAVWTRAAGVAMLTRDAGWEATRRTALETQATATALFGAAEQDAQARTRAALWGWLGLLTVAGFVGGGLYTLYSYAYRRVAQARIIRNDRTGAPVALWVGRGMWELIEPEPIPALPAPNGNGEPDRVIRVNTPREPMFQHSDDVLLEHGNERMLFSLRQRRQLRAWYESGITSIRRTTSPVGPGLNEIGVSGGDAYQMAYRLLQHYGYIDAESNEWTRSGIQEFLNV